jgi:hypothetical protein
MTITETKILIALLSIPICVAYHIGLIIPLYCISLSIVSWVRTAPTIEK